MANNYEVKLSATLQLEIDYLRDELAKYKQENIKKDKNGK